MTAIEKLKDWIMTYEGMSDFDSIAVDFTSDIPANAGIFPAGVVEIGRRTDITGKVFEVINQYNFALYAIFTKSPYDDYGSKLNAEWLVSFQEWIQEQSISGLAPVFGDVKSKETIKAQNGTLYEATDEGIGTYMVQIAVQFVKRY